MLRHFIGTMRLFLLIALSLLSIIPAHASGKKQPPISITFHLVTENNDGKKFTIPVDTPHGKRFIERTPIIGTSDIIAYHAFPSPHNEEFYGVSLQLNKVGANRLRAISGNNMGAWIAASINGNVVDMIHIDKPVDGRVITIWRNIDAPTLQLCDSLIPKIGESKEDWEKRRKLIEKQKN